MKENQKDVKSFVEKVIIADIKKMQDNDLHYLSLVLIGQSIETLGGFLDKKPFRARAQSNNRFDKAINILFPAKYKIVNKGGWLFDKLRNHMAHMLIPSSYLLIYSKKEDTDYKHLQEVDKSVVIIAEEFYKDLAAASNILIDKIDKGIIKNRNI